MRPHQRPPIIRKTIKWGGPLAMALLAVVWAASGWWHLSWTGTRASCGIGQGCVYVGEHRVYPEDWRGVSMSKLRRPPSWMLLPSSNLVSDNVDPKPFRNYIVPIWIFEILILAATWRAWHLDMLARRARLNLCVACGYDRKGIAADAKCPECGASAGGPA
jgi:hypothetical protein